MQYSSEVTVHNSKEQPNGIQGNWETGQILVTEKQDIETCMYVNCYIYFYVAKNIYVEKLEIVFIFALFATNGMLHSENSMLTLQAKKFGWLFP